jgi:hypothetical protein
MLSWRIFSMDRYYKYIAHLRKKEGALIKFGVKTQVHRIIPGHAKGKYTPENSVRCTLKDHICAHKIRWEVYRETGDLSSVNMMTGRINAGGDAVVPTLGAYATHEICKRNKRGFWDPEQQRQNALKGNTPEVRKKKGEGGARGNQVIREKGVGVYAPGQAARSGRASGMRRKGFRIEGLGKLRYSDEDRMSLSETFFDYYVAFGKTW